MQRPFGVAENLGSLENPIPALCRRLEPFPAVYCDKLNTRQREGCPAPAARHIVFPLLRLACQPAEQSTGELTLASAALFHFFLFRYRVNSSATVGATEPRGGKSLKRCQITDNSAAVQLHQCAAAAIKRSGRARLQQVQPSDNSRARRLLVFS